jgi:hypothetical protein
MAHANVLSHGFTDPDAAWRCGNDEAFVPSDSCAMCGVMLKEVQQGTLTVNGTAGLDERPLQPFFPSGLYDSVAIEQVSCDKVGAFDASE